jgi:D-aminopeptidase
MMRRPAPFPARLAGLCAAVAVLSLSAAAPRPAMAQQTAPDADRPRARDLGITVGVFQPGANNAITDVAGVRVGHTTVIEGDDVRTGVTAIHPVDANPYFSRPPAAMFVGNGYGKLLGVTQVRELGELETPILLTCTLCVWKAADAMVEWMLDREGMGGVGSLNAVVGETNDGGLNDIRARPITSDHVVAALEGATDGQVEEGSVGAGTGTRAFGWKGGIGTSSRVLPEQYGGYTVGVLVQSNFGGILTMDGAPVGQELGRYSFRGAVEPGDDEVDLNDIDVGDGSIMMVVATDAPLSDRNLERLAARAIMGLARTGSFAGNGSGDYVIAFSTADEVRRGRDGADTPSAGLENSDMSALFQGVVESTEEAIYNSLLKATTVTGIRGSTADALPIEETVEVLRRFGVIGR